MTTIIECLANAELNLKSGIPAARTIGIEQLHNAIVLLDKGYSIHSDVDSLLKQYINIEDVPEIE